jgi:hypothetical protein
MNYELCKKLKDAGFQQRNLQFGSCGHYENDEWIKSPNFCGCLVHKPYLEELIEACGDRFKELYVHGYTEWVAYSDNKHEFKGEGKTPSEAVANLWLELNK